MPASDSLKSHYEDRTRAASAWSEAGGRVIGFTGPPCPVELIAAAGFLPVRVSGSPAGGREAFDKYALPTHPKWSTGPRQIALGYVNAMTEAVLNGSWSVLDRLIVSNPRKAVYLIHTILCHSRQMDPELQAPESYFVDHTIVSSYDGARFHLRVFEKLRAALEAWSGKPITEAALADAIAQANETRALLARLNAFRIEQAPRLSGSLALAAIGAVQTMPAAQANELLASLIEEVEAAPHRDGPRIFVAGSALDNDALYRAIEASGAIVVGESHSWGAAAFGPAIRTDIAPFAAAADHFHRQRPDAVYPIAEAVAGMARQVEAAKPDLAVFQVYHADDHLAWQAPSEMEAVRALGVPTLYLSEAPYQPEDPAIIGRKIADALGTAARPLETAQ